MCRIFAAICLNNIGGLCTNIYTHSCTEKSISDACTCMDAYICMVIQRRFSLSLNYRGESGRIRWSYGCANFVA
jgi:hypothetical protein